MLLFYTGFSPFDFCCCPNLKYVKNLAVLDAALISQFQLLNSWNIRRIWIVSLGGQKVKGIFHN